MNVRDFGAIPDDGTNDAAALRAAVQACRVNGAGTLLFPPGKYLLADDKAITLQNEAMSGVHGNALQGLIFNLHYDYVIGLDFKGIKNLAIQAAGAELLCDGWMEPVSLVETENLTINGLSIDYKRPPNSIGRVIDVGGGHVDVKFIDECPVTDGMGFLRTMIWDDGEDRFVGNASVPGGKLIAPQVLRFSPFSGPFKIGRVLWALHGFHFRPAILLYKAKNTTLNDISIYAQPGMGIVGHLSENILMNRLRIVPKPGRYCSSNTDATHFASCYGSLEFNDCDFAGQGDDATNVHNYYHSIISKQGANGCTFGLTGGFDFHSQKPDVPRVGDTLALVKSQTLEEAGYVTVNKVVGVDPQNAYVTIDFSGALPPDIGNYYLADISALPRFIFRNSRVKSHRARSVLCKTRMALIEGNTFDGCTGTAIHIGAEGDWKEGVPSRDIVIRGNTFNRNGGGDGTIDDASAVAIHVNASRTDVPGLHQRILIENNKGSSPGAGHFISVKGAEDVTIRNNTFTGIANAGQALTVGASRRVAAYGNAGMQDYFSNDGTPRLPEIAVPTAIRVPIANLPTVTAPLHKPRYSLLGRLRPR